MLRDYLGLRRDIADRPITDLVHLRRFIDAHASYVAQTTLYGYMRTRAGTRYPELFKDEGMSASLNIAKWQIWLACLSDLSAYVARVLYETSEVSQDECKQLVLEEVMAILDAVGDPVEAVQSFGASKNQLLERLRAIEFTAIADVGDIFSYSPQALIDWAPVADHMRESDNEIMRNSVRFKWNEVQRKLQKQLRVRELFVSRSTINS